MSILDKIVTQKKDRVKTSKYNASISSLKSRINEISAPLDFAEAIRKNTPSLKLIAEIKKASPSKGLIRQEFDPSDISLIYEAKKVDAISVITEQDFFMGDLGFLDIVRKKTTRPILRKDFIIDSYQIYESRAHTADAILLISSILEPNQADDYLRIAMDLGMTVLYEVHDHRELETALNIKAPVIGINNRNLRTMQIDLDTTFSLLRDIPEDIIVVSESGISSFDDNIRLMDSRVDAVLIGTAIMISDNIGDKIDKLRGIGSSGSVLK